MTAIVISGAELATRFCTEASRILTDADFFQLERFLTTAPRSSTATPDAQNTLSEMLRQFYSEEVETSGQDRNRLATPSGPVNATLGLVMHIQTKKGAVGPFWDHTNTSIQALAAKGLSETFTFGFDWHWRAEESARRRGACPTTAWAEALRRAHDRISRDILALLPLPFVVVAGACPRRQYKKVASGTVTTLEMEIIPGLALTIDLQFDNERLRRITTYVDHPAVGFYNPSTAEAQTLRLDAAFNLVLWLLKRDHCPTSFQSFYFSYRRTGTVPNAAPLAELWGYVRVEAGRQVTLQLDEYKLSFLSWATRFLGKDLATIINGGGSIASAVRAELGSRISRSKSYRAEDGQKTQRPKYRPRGTVCIPCRKVHSRRCDGNVPCSSCVRLSIVCNSDGLQQSISNYRVLQSRSGSVDQIGMPALDDFGQTLVKRPKTLEMESSTRVTSMSNPSESLPAATTERNLPNSDTLSRHNRKINQDRYKYAIREYWHGHPVAVRKNGDIRIHISPDIPSLKLRMSSRQATEIHKHTETPTIHFCLEGILLKWNGRVLYRRTKSAIESSRQQGAEWMAQWEKELRRL